MTQWLKQSTAVTIKFGPFVDSTDGTTAETALTIQKADVRLSKNGGNYASASADQGVADAGAPHDELGDYDVSLDATDTNTLGTLRAIVKETGALVVWTDFMIVPANVWDSMFGADKLQVHADEITAGLITAAAIATNAIDADALAADAIDEIWDEVIEGTTTARQTMRLANSANASKTSGMGTATGTIRDIGDTKDRIVATVDVDGNRSAITLDVS